MTIHTRINKSAFVILSCLWLMGMQGCTQPMEELDAYVASIKRRPPPALEPIPPIKVFPVFLYQPELMRNPFGIDGEDTETADGEDAQPDDADCPDLLRVREQLEAEALDSLDMVGTMNQGAFYGLVKDPTGTVHRVKVGDYMGQNYGQIIAITDDKIELEERVKDGIGGCERRNQAISLDNN